MDKYIISAEEISANNVKSAADLLKGDPAQNKSVFDRLPELIAEKLNGFIVAVKAKFAEYYTKAETEAVIDERMQQAGNADMQQAVYDKNHNGVVDDAERLGGHLPEYFANQDTAVLKSGGKLTGNVEAASVAGDVLGIRNMIFFDSAGVEITDNISAIKCYDK